MINSRSRVLVFIEGHLSAAGDKSEQISVIVHRSATDKLAVDSLVLLVCGLSIIPPKRSRERKRVSGRLFLIKDLSTRVWQTLQVFIYVCWSITFKNAAPQNVTDNT